jgi:hypothetical protein
MNPESDMTSLLHLATELVAAERVTLADGRLLRLCRDHDTDTSINDYDCYGRVEPVREQPHSYRDAPRPEGFDGAAVKIIDAWGDRWWWQPTLELWGTPRAEWHADAERRRREIDNVRDLLTWGFGILRVELCQGTDAYGRPIVVDYATVGGIEPFGDDTDVVADLLAELGVDVIPSTT